MNISENHSIRQNIPGMSDSHYSGTIMYQGRKFDYNDLTELSTILKELPLDKIIYITSHVFNKVKEDYEKREIDKIFFEKQKEIIKNIINDVLTHEGKSLTHTGKSIEYSTEKENYPRVKETDSLFKRKAQLDSLETKKELEEKVKVTSQKPIVERMAEPIELIRRFRNSIASIASIILFEKGGVKGAIGKLEESIKKAQKDGQLEDQKDLIVVRNALPDTIANFEQELQMTEQLLQAQLTESLQNPDEVKHLFERDSRGGVTFQRVDKDIKDITPIPSPTLTAEQRVVASHSSIDKMIQTPSDENWRLPLKVINTQSVLNTIASPVSGPLTTAVKMAAIQEDDSRNSQVKAEVPKERPPIMNEVIRDSEGNIAKILVKVDVPVSIVKESHAIDEHGNPEKVDVLLPNLITAKMECEATLNEKNELTIKITKLMVE